MGGTNKTVSNAMDQVRSQVKSQLIINAMKQVLVISSFMSHAVDQVS